MASSDDPKDVVMPPHNKAKQGRAVPVRQAPRLPKRMSRRSVGSAKRNSERKGTGGY